MQRPIRRLLAVVAVAVVLMSVGYAGDLSSARSRELLAPVPSPPAAGLFVRTPAKSNTITDVYVDQLGSTIPQSFLGLSHEWGQVDQLAANKDYVALLKQFTSYGTGPLLFRIGGSSTDRQTYVPANSVWSALKSLHDQTGCKFMIGLNFENGDVGLAQRQMQAAKAQLPADAIWSWEIGNEPNYYVNISTSQGLVSGVDYVRCCLVQQWAQFSQQMSCPNGNSCAYNGFVGPVWGDIFPFPTTLQWFLQNTHNWINFVSLHWYKAQMEANTTPVTLIEESALNDAMNSLKQLIAVAGQFGKQVRIDESNTLSNGGKPGVCDTMGAALWTLDGAMSAAKTGATGINIHQSSGQAVYTSIYRTGKTSASAQAPWYGMMLFQQAVQGGVRFVNSNSYGGPSNVKVYMLKAIKTGKLRALLLNKDQSNAANVTMRLNRSSGFGGAVLTRLVAKGTAPLYAGPSSMTLSGMRWASTGASMTGSNVTEYVKKQGPINGQLVYTVYLPAGSAAVVAWY